MNDDSISRGHTVRIDRIVLDGVSTDRMQPDQFREQLSREIRRLISRPGSLEDLRGDRQVERISQDLDETELSDPAAVARHVVGAIQSSPRQYDER